jgi:hypothetical protein
MLHTCSTCVFYVRGRDVRLGVVLPRSAFLIPKLLLILRFHDTSLLYHTIRRRLPPLQKLETSFERVNTRGVLVGLAMGQALKAACRRRGAAAVTRRAGGRAGGRAGDAAPPRPKRQVRRGHRRELHLHGAIYI